MAIIGATISPASAALTFRPAVEEDLILLGEVAAAAFEHHPETAVTSPALRHQETITEAPQLVNAKRLKSETRNVIEAFQNPVWLLEVAEVDGKVVGFAQWFLPATTADDDHDDDDNSDDSDDNDEGVESEDARSLDLEQAKGQLVSFATKFLGGSRKLFGLQNLAVSPGYQNHNIGSRLLSNGLRLASQHGWRVAAVCAGERLLEFYTRRGLDWLAKTTSHDVDLYVVVDAGIE
ncbi:hypothetical protein V8F20_005412 [Naviculisporaceae sp. PSN 640]